jgi:RNA polymerase sigma-70 factor (ECF subfamily)
VNYSEDRLVDEFLIIRCQASDETALSALIAKWQPAFIRYAAVITRDHALAADVVQDAWIKIIRSLPRLREPEKFAAWSYRIVNHQCIDALKATKSTVSEVEQAGPSTIRELEAKDQVWWVLDQLSPEHRSVLALHYLQGFDVKEIAGIVRKPTGTIKSRLFNAREKFKLILEEEILETVTSNGGTNDEPNTRQKNSGSSGVSYRPA